MESAGRDGSKCSVQSFEFGGKGISVIPGSGLAVMPGQPDVEDLNLCSPPIPSSHIVESSIHVRPRISEGWTRVPHPNGETWITVLQEQIGELESRIHDMLNHQSERLIREFGVSTLAASQRQLVRAPSVFYSGTTVHGRVEAPGRSKTSTLGWKCDEEMPNGESDRVEKTLQKEVAVCVEERDEGVETLSAKATSANSGSAQLTKHGTEAEEIAKSLLMKHQKTKRLNKSKTSTKVARLQELALTQGWVRNSAWEQKDRGRLASIVQSKWFDSTVCAAIILNSILLAVSTDHAARNEIVELDEMPAVYVVVDHFFSVFFLLELLIRMINDGPLRFWSFLNVQWAWNYFDTVVVSFNILETIMYFVSAGQGQLNITALRVLRVLRVARAIRILKLIGAFKELRLMVMSVLGSFTTLIWAIVLLMMVIFIFAIFLTQNVTSYLYREVNSLDGNAHAAKLREMFGSIVRATYTLFMAISGGIDWQEISDRLFDIDWFNGCLFCFYIFFTVFAMLNVITGVFLDTAIRTAQGDKDECISDQLSSQNVAVKQIQEIFRMVDTDRSSSITAEEFEKHLTDPRMHAQLATLGIEASEAQGLFRLLDVDNSGSITLDEFLYGCMRVKGGAKAIDVATLMYENKRMFDKWNDFQSSIESYFQECRAFEDKLELVMDKVLLALGVTMTGEAWEIERGSAIENDAPSELQLAIPGMTIPAPPA